MVHSKRIRFVDASADKLISVGYHPLTLFPGSDSRWFTQCQAGTCQGPWEPEGTIGEVSSAADGTPSAIEAVFTTQSRSSTSTAQARPT